MIHETNCNIDSRCRKMIQTHSSFTLPLSIDRASLCPCRSIDLICSVAFQVTEPLAAECSLVVGVQILHRARVLRVVHLLILNNQHLSIKIPSFFTRKSSFSSYITDQVHVLTRPVKPLPAVTAVIMKLFPEALIGSWYLRRSDCTVHARRRAQT